MDATRLAELDKLTDMILTGVYTPADEVRWDALLDKHLGRVPAPEGWRAVPGQTPAQATEAFFREFVG